MKVEFIKEESVGKPTHYYTEVDGAYVTGTLFLNQDEAYAVFNKILDQVQSGRGIDPSKTIIDSWDSEKITKPTF